MSVMRRVMKQGAAALKEHGDRMTRWQSKNCQLDLP